MREIVSWCDICIKAGKRSIVADEYTISVSIGKATAVTRTVDLCAEHKATVDEPIRAIMEYGRKPTIVDDESPEKARPVYRAKRVTCPLEGLEMWSNSLPAHFAAKHGLPRYRHPSQCPDCEFVNKAPQSMGVHRSTAHGWDVVAELEGQYKALHKIGSRRKMNKA